jgi:hypothetical protein
MGYFGGEAPKITHQITIDRVLSIEGKDREFDVFVGASPHKHIKFSVILIDT